MKWFDVDKNGLRKLLERKGKAFFLAELVQNAWDEEGVTFVDIMLTPIPGRPACSLTVIDDAPAGFEDLRDAYTLFAESKKKSNPHQRGRFNLGEKLVLAFCEWAEIISTKGGLLFNDNGRRKLRQKREKGTIFNACVKMTREEYTEAIDAFSMLIPPPEIKTVINGNPLPCRQPLCQFEAQLATEIADEDGNLKRTKRKTWIRVYEPYEGEEASIYEMGIPIVTTGDRYHVDIQQKVPLNLDRDNVPPAFLSQLRCEVLNNVAETLTAGEAQEGWVRDASGHKDCSGEAVEKVMSLLYGEKRASFDPTDKEANFNATAHGYAVIHGRSLSPGQWENVRKHGAVIPAGKIMPTPKAYGDGDGPPVKIIPEHEWSGGMCVTMHFFDELVLRVSSARIKMCIVHTTNSFAAAHCTSEIHWNLFRLGKRWFECPDIDIKVDLFCHEMAHHVCPNHLDSKYHKELSRLAGAIAVIALDKPEIFEAVRQLKG